ncbi:tol-pal system-associated acyl-CoA thioesterase [Comamonas kerstersii]|jgi:acyl-CoA thioester hydrolase|uniref:4-hydroxybenzoyl-CoA thioesterase n=1 Tax=Comamonas kerstersii TaxID=225992 RepID=A0A0W7Z167_9BURK|nr:tol-pal system-associated acyl-CoA thioesterase [Comamonas kerstersii]MDO4969782.1 tol-pal system-associated acyl-CoA thioesterase [Comamonadaceae bacterium]AQZ98695.1 tol-pal system-associated acyl-CoA thioesterase [Comamonas kerstersii]KUF41048.1 4-hydroxybenzoyl-CoA thioesterase [Comamonas kerstersii]OOH85993.1 tol-pal system-associated acyl-CoA thioesterase [Comamonas kerstersii]OOH92760.1 tol-pal system-associated acyl-CoA thioesterase [Comamonas kerstersii]
MAFTFPIRVYWEDTDAGGIVFYANYLKFFERARTEWLRNLGVEQQKLRDEVGGMFVVTHAEINYLQPARLDDVMEVTAVLESAGRASMTIAQQAFLKPVSSDQAPQLLCEGSIRIGWVDSTTMRPARIPKSILETLS